ncbi:MAG: PAS domain S-box protein [Acidobacteriia bacterium]|nr:PAS domain S-box protein [Terriglobia bacterium]
MLSLVQNGEARFRALLENCADLVLLLDSAGQIVYCNAASEPLLGYKPEELIGDCAVQLIHPEDQPALQDLCERLIRDGEETITARARVHRKDGTWRLLEGRARNLLDRCDVEAVAVNCRDVTDEVHAEEDLRKSKERFAKAFRSSPLATTISTVDEGRYVDVNDAFLQLLNLQRQDVIGRTAVEVGFWVEPEERSRLLQGLWASGTVKGLPNGIRTSSGQIREVSVSAELIELDGLTCVLAITQDVSETKQLEEQVRQAQKMEAIGRLAGGVAHDFNNVLSVVMGYSDLALERLDPSHPVARNLSQIKKAAKGAAALTRQLLAFSRQQILFPRVLDLNSVVNNLNDMLLRLIGEDVSLTFKAGDGLGSIEADLGQVQQILMNLVVNGRDAMPTGGRIIIETSNVDLQEGYVGANAPAMSPGRYVMLSVSDTGCGMDEKTMAYIFEPFFTTKGPGQGTGLGLSTVYGIVKQSNGNIWVYSEPGAGTTFKLYFPRVEAYPKSMASPVAELASVGGSETILVVEDDDSLRTLTVALLAGAGYKVLEAANAEMAICLAEEHKEAIDIVLTDVIMPGMSGRELAQRVRALRPEMKVLLMSGYAPDMIARYGAMEPSVALIEKPFTRHSLLAALSTVLCEKRAS